MKKVFLCLALAFASFLVAIGSFFMHDVTAYHTWINTNGPRIMERFHKDDRPGMEKKHHDEKHPMDQDDRQNGPEDKRGPGMMNGNMGPDNHMRQDGNGQAAPQKQGAPAADENSGDSGSTGETSDAGNNN